MGGFPQAAGERAAGRDSHPTLRELTIPAWVMGTNPQPHPTGVGIAWCTPVDASQEQQKGKRRRKAGSVDRLTFLHLLFLVSFSCTQESEDDSRLGVDTHGCHHHPARALHHMGT